MDEPRTRKPEEASLDRGDPAGTGGWFFLKGKDTVDILRAFARWDALSRGVGLVLLGACAWYLRELANAIRACVPYLQHIQDLLGK